MQQVLDFLTPSRRKRIYTIAVALMPLLVLYGVLSDNEATLYVGLIAAVLGVATNGLAAANTPPTDGNNATEGD